MEAIRTYWTPVVAILGALGSVFAFYLSMTYLSRSDAEAEYVRKEIHALELRLISDELERLRKDLSETKETSKETNRWLMELVSGD